MSTIFDWITVCSFIALVVFFIKENNQDHDHSNVRLAKFVAGGVAFMIANQLGNAGWVILAWALIVASILYCTLLVSKLV